MNKTKNHKLTGISKVLRRNMTDEEKHLWYDFLKKIPKTIHRQKVIGNYVVDFYCSSPKIVIELDGSQHRTKQGLQDDFLRDAYLSDLGIKVLRYSNLDVLTHFDCVCADISRHLNIFTEEESEVQENDPSSGSLLSPPSPRGEG